jgi:hypothetical protein
MNINLTTQLLFSLAAAAILGAIIGGSLQRLWAARRQRNLSTAQQQTIESQALSIEAVTYERDVARRSLLSERRSASQAVEQTEEVTAQHDALQVHSRMQARRIETFESERLATARQDKQLQKDFANNTDSKSSELSSTGKSAVGVQEADSVPVLNRRVLGGSRSRIGTKTEGRHAAARSLHATRPPPLISREFEIPVLAESELPASVDDLEFEVVGTGDDNGVPKRG